MRNLNSLKLVSALALAGILSACSTSPRDVADRNTDVEVYEKEAGECTYKDGQTKAPRWTCGYPVHERYVIFEVGYSQSGLEEEARAIALNRLAGRINTDIKTQTDTMVENAGRTNNSTFRQVSTQLTNEALVDTRVVLRQLDPTTRGLYVLVVVNEERYREALQRARTSVLTGE